MTKLAPVFVPPGQGPVLPAPGGDHSVPKISAAQTDDRFSLAEYTVVPGGGTPLHIHTREDEAFWILEGEVAFFVDGKVIAAPAGSFVYAPRTVPHCFKNRTATPARMLLLLTPARNFEAFYEMIGAAAADGGAPSEGEIMGRIMREAGRFGIQILGPSPL